MVKYAKPDETLDTDAESTGGGWADKGGGSSLHLSIDDTPGAAADDATTYIYATDNGDAEGCIVGLEDVDEPDSSGTYIKYKALTEDQSMGGAPGLKLELLQGSVVKATTTNTSVDESSFTAYSYTISDVSGISVTDGVWANLRLRITMLAGGGMGDTMKVTQAYLETQDPAVAESSSPRALKHIIYY